MPIDHIELAKQAVDNMPEWKRKVFEPAETRDLDADLAICEAATPGPINATYFINQARQGWPYAIRRAQEAERENDRLRNELDILQEQLRQHRRSASPSGCFD